MTGSDNEQEQPRGVGSLRSRFEALATQGNAPHGPGSLPRKPSTKSFLNLPAQAALRARAASTPPASPHSGPSTEYFGAVDGTNMSPESSRSIRSSPSQPDLSFRGGSSEGSNSVASGSPPVTPGSEDLPEVTPRATPVGKPVVPPRPVPSLSTASLPTPAAAPRKPPPPPIPVRKHAATMPVAPASAPVSSGASPVLPPRSASPSTILTGENGLPMPPIRRTLSPSPAASPLSISPRPTASLEEMRTLRNSRSARSLNGSFTSLETVDEVSIGPPVIPPRPQTEPGEMLSSSPKQPPPLPNRRPPSRGASPTPSPSTSSPTKPPIPSRLGLAQPNAGPRRASEADAGRLRSGSAPPPMSQSLSDDGVPKAIRPPPMRTVGNAPVVPVRPVTGAASANWNSDSDGEDEDINAPDKKAIDDLPDATYASRWAPELSPPRVITSKSTLTAVTAHGTHVVTCGLHHVRVYDAHTGSQVLNVALPGEPKTTFVEFRGPNVNAKEREDDGRHVWVGCKDGSVTSIDLLNGQVCNSRTMSHGQAVTGIFRRGTDMVTLDESGKVQVWMVSDKREVSLGETMPKTFRIDKASFTKLLNDKLWTATTVPRIGGSGSANRAPVIKVYAPFASDSAAFTSTSRADSPPDTSGPVGAVTAATTLQSWPGHVLLGHETGHISIWSDSTFECVEVLRVSGTGITSLCGVGPLLWAGYRTGSIYVYDIEPRPWKVVKAWKAHKDAVTTIFVDSSSLWLTNSLHVISVGLDQVIHFWDGFLRTDWLAMHLLKREADFCSYKPLRILMCSWNLDAAKPSDLSADTLGSELLNNVLHSVDAPDVIVFGFQEMIDLEDKKLTAKSLFFGRKRADSLLSDNVSGQYRLWHDKLIQAVRIAMPQDCPYSVTHTENLVGLFTCVFVKNSERLRLRDMDVSTVKTGMGGRYGNKGAIVSRFVIDDSSICFVNCHLAAGQSHKRQRNKDLIEILETKAPFAEVHPSSKQDAWISGGDGSMIFDHSLVFLSGDLNYRVDMRREVVIGNVGENKLEPLLAQDQLLKETRTNSAFRLKSFTEAPITFAPTYKYDRGSDVYDTSEKARAPAWCDRILWRVNDAASVQPLHYDRHEVRVSDHRPISAGFIVRVRRVDPARKQAVQDEIALRWSEHETSLIAKAKTFHEISR